MRSPPVHIHVSSLTRRELHRCRRRRRLATFPLLSVAALIAADAALVLAVTADRLF